MKYLVFLTVFVIAYIVYAFTWPATVFWQDAGIYLTAIKTLGIAYPPGFPLYVMLGHVWTKIIPWGSLAQKVYAFSAVWGAGTASLMGLCAWEVFHLRGFRALRALGTNTDTSGESIRPLPVWLNFVASLITGLTTAFSYSLWAQSINAEVYSFHAFFTVAFLYLMLRLFSRSVPPSEESRQMAGHRRRRDFAQGHLGGVWRFRKKIWLLMAVVLGLSFANHPLAITFLAPLAYLLYQNRKIVIKRWPFFLLLGLIFVACGFLPYLYLPIRAKMNPELNWGDPSTLERFFQHITGGGGYLAPFSLEYRFKLKTILNLFWEEFFVLPIILGLVGFYYLYKKDQKLAEALFLFAISILVLYYLYTKGEVFWLIPFYLVFILCFAFGLRWFLLRIKDQGLALLVGVMIGLFSVIPLLGFNWRYLDRSDYYTAADFGKNILRPLEENAILFILGDQPSSTVLYLQKVEGFRPDVVVFYPGELDSVHGWQVLSKKFSYLKWPDIDEEEDLGKLINRLVELNLSDHAIYFLSLKSLPGNFPYPLIAASAFWKVSLDKDEAIDEKYWDFQFSDPQFFKRPMKKEERKKTYLANGQESYLTQTYHHGVIDFLAQAYKNLGGWYYVRGECEKAVESYGKIFVYNKDLKHEEVMRNIEFCRMKLSK